MTTAEQSNSPRYIAQRARSSKTRTPMIRADKSTTPAASASSPPSTASRAARSSLHGDRGAESGLAPRRGRRRRQDRRRRRHPHQMPAGFLRATRSRRTGHEPRAARIVIGMIFLPRTDLAAQEALPHHRRSRDPRASASTIYGWRQVPVDISVIGEKANATRPEIEQILFDDRQRADERADRARPLHHPPPHREARCARQHPELLHLLAVGALADLQGHVPRRAAHDLLSRSPGRALRLAVAIYPPALFDQHLPDLAPGAALPHARPQRRDQHAEGQHQLDEEP